MIDEGVIKFDCDWTNQPIRIDVPNELKKWRDDMYQLKLIGVYEDVNIGYGNISVKVDQGILISGTQTGNIERIKNEDFALVTSYNMGENSVSCRGLLKASAECLTHAGVYECDKSIHAIIHIHNKEMWLKLMGKVPTSDKSVPYGTSKMASEIKRLFKETSLADDKILVMAGHDEGIIAFGKDLEEAGAIILKYVI
jgi:ribulose-5-phosphate 4-epimerase/fuculose-1-phosphate aldolase